jgi:hypothetical protein
MLDKYEEGMDNKQTPLEAESKGHSELLDLNNFIAHTSGFIQKESDFTV